MAKAFFSNNLPLPGPPSPSEPSRPPAGRRNIIAAAASGFAGLSAVKHAVDRAAVLVRSTPPSGVDAGGTGEAGSTTTVEEKAPNASLNPKGRFNLAHLPNIPVWARWFLGSLVIFSLPFYKKFLSIEDEVEKTVETAVEVAEEVAKVTKNVVADVAESLPDGALKKLAVEVEEIAEVAIVDSEKVKSFICKVEEVKEEMEQVVDPIAKDAGDMFLKGKSS